MDTAQELDRLATNMRRRIDDLDKLGAKGTGITMDRDEYLGLIDLIQKMAGFARSASLLKDVNVELVDALSTRRALL